LDEGAVSRRGLRFHALPAAQRDNAIGDTAVRDSAIGENMRIFALLISLCALSQAAMAETPECKTIGNSNARLACYDKAAPPIAKPVVAKGTPVKSEGAQDGTKYVDQISAEDARVTAKLKGICHGC
jgi:hypothetical protein